MTEGSIEPGTFGFVSPKYGKVQDKHIMDMNKDSLGKQSSKKQKKEKVAIDADKPADSIDKAKEKLAKSGGKTFMSPTKSSVINHAASINNSEK